MNNKNAELFSSRFGYHNYITIVSYIAKLKPELKSVLLLSTNIHKPNISQNKLSNFENIDKKKPEIIIKYNKTKG